MAVYFTEARFREIVLRRRFAHEPHVRAEGVSATEGGNLHDPVARTGCSERPHWRTFDFRSVSSGATGIEVFRLPA